MKAETIIRARKNRGLIILLVSLLTVFGACTLPNPNTTPVPTTAPTLMPTSTPIPVFRFAVLGDYGNDGKWERAVAALIKSWNPDFIITTGDNNYPDGAADTIDDNIGQYFHEYIGNYSGKYGEGSRVNRFFPTLGNHDWVAKDAQPYLDYFTLPGNERYYDFVQGPIHFFCIDSENKDPDGVKEDSVQAMWLKQKLAESTSPWNIVFMHRAPYSSGTEHGSKDYLQWRFESWGADVVMSGHDHVYERLVIGDVVYFVNGVGGSGLYECGELVNGSQLCYDKANGAMLVEATFQSINFKFVNTLGETIDDYTLIAKP